MSGKWLLRMRRNSQAPNKFRVLLAVIIPVAIILFSAGLFVHKFNEVIEFTYKELQGIHEVNSIYGFLYVTQEIRGLRQMQIGGNRNQGDKIKERQQRLEAMLNASSSEPHANWLNVKSELDSLSNVIRQLFVAKDAPPDSLELFDRYSAFNRRLIAMLKQVADSSNLTLDPELDSHLLEELVVDRLPRFIEQVAILRGLTAYAAERTDQPAGLNLRVQYLLHRLSDEQANIKVRYESLMHSNTTINRIKPGIELLLTSSEAYSEFVKSRMKNSYKGIAAEQVFEQGSATIKILAELVDHANTLAAGKLSERYQALESTRNIVVSGLSLATLLFLGVVFNYFRSNRKAYSHLLDARNALATAQSRNTAIVDTVADGIISIDANGIVHNFNPAAERIFGYRASEVIGKNIKMLMPEPYSEEHDTYLQNYLTSGNRKIIGIGREVEGQHKNGSVFPLDLAVNEMAIEGERFFTGIVRDITDRKRVENIKNEFISTVSHELRTPLTSIRGSLGLISGGAVGEVSEKVRELLTIAGNNTERLLVLINDILDLQKIESGKMAFKFKMMEVMPFIYKAVDENKSYAAQYDVKFEVVQHEENLRVFADQDRLMQVVNNLLSNAVKFSPAGSTVQITVAQHDGATRISVSDHGEGIPEHFRQHIFEKFSQSDASDSRSKGGTGLGLSIAKLIIEKHGGRINYLTQVGVGSTFYFELPELVSKVTPNIAESHLRLEEHVACVLIVEDDHDIAALLRRMLTEAGFNCDVAYSAVEARSLLKKNFRNYQVMTVDINLPDENGLSLLRSLRNDPQTQAIPVVVISVMADEGKIELNGSAVSVIDWISKPIDQERLIRAIGQVASQHQLPRVLHIEDDEDIHKIVACMLQGHCDLMWAKTIAAAKEILEKEKFDLVVLDIVLPDGSGLDLLEMIEQAASQPQVVIFSANEVPGEYLSRVKAVLKKSSINNQELLKVITGCIKK